jgi:GT2 family glycosyltransferase
MKIVAVIPTLGERPELLPLVSQLIKEDIDTIVLGWPGENLHHIWNQGARIARDERQADAIAILNDDIILPPDTLKTMYETMIAKDFACVGVDTKAPFGITENCFVHEVSGGVERLMLGVTTWCFLVKASAWQDIDEQYEWWWGVGDLFVKVQQAGGKLGQVRGLGITHIGSGTARNHPWTKTAIDRDKQRWRESH